MNKLSVVCAPELFLAILYQQVIGTASHCRSAQTLIGVDHSDEIISPEYARATTSGASIINYMTMPKCLVEIHLALGRVRASLETSSEGFTKGQGQKGLMRLYGVDGALAQEFIPTLSSHIEGYDT